MKKPPYYKWCPAEHIETASMDHFQKSCYRTLWDYCLTLEGLPQDLRELAAICAYSPAPDFEKAIWTKIKKHFYEADGKYWIGSLEIQVKKDKKFRKLQSSKGKWPRHKELEYQPAVEPLVEPSVKPNSNRIETEGCDTIPAEIKSNRNATGGLTESQPNGNRRLMAEEPIVEPVTEEQPDSNQTATESQPTVQPTVALEIPAIAVKNNKVSRETLSVSENENNPDIYFDSYAAWQEFADIYPQENLVDDKQAMDLFLKIVINGFWNKRLLRATINFREWLAENGLSPQYFVSWVAEWQAWEDLKVVKSE